MGFSNRERKTYVQLYDGRFVIRVSPNTPGAVQRVNKEKKVVWEVAHEQYDGMLTAFFIKQSKFGDQLVVEMDNSYQFEVSYSSRPTKEFLTALPNIDWTKRLWIRPYKFTPADSTKEYRGWSFYQEQEADSGRETKVPPAYTKEQIPRMKEVVLRGQKVWDDTEQLKFLWAGAMEWADRTGFGSDAAPTEPPPDQAPEAEPDWARDIP